MAWLMEAIPATAGETFDIQIEQPPQSTPPQEEEPAEETPATPSDAKPNPDNNNDGNDDDHDLAPCGPSLCGPIIQHCPPGAPCISSINSITDDLNQLPQVFVAEMSLEQRMQVYATV
jgi:hypothetical protein